VVVGDVEPKSAIALARQYFEPIPAQAAPDPIRTKEPVQEGERRVNIEAEAQSPLLQFAYHSLSGADPRQAALELLTRILTDGDASRLHRVLVEEQKLAISADSYIDRGFDPGCGRRCAESGSSVRSRDRALARRRRDRAGADTRAQPGTR
jgi:zinc protease